MNNVVATHLLELKLITDVMVSQKRITKEEQIDFLAKAGLTKQNDVWVDEANAKYSF